MNKLGRIFVVLVFGFGASSWAQDGENQESHRLEKGVVTSAAGGLARLSMPQSGDGRVRAAHTNHLLRQRGRTLNLLDQNQILDQINSGDEVRIVYNLSPEESRNHMLKEQQSKIDRAKTIKRNLQTQIQSAKPGQVPDLIKRVQRIEDAIDILEQQRMQIANIPLNKVEIIQRSETLKVGSQGHANVTRFLEAGTVRGDKVVRVTRFSGAAALVKRSRVRSAGTVLFLAGAGLMISDRRVAEPTLEKFNEAIEVYETVLPPAETGTDSGM